MSKEIPFKSIVVGEVLGPIEYTIKKRHVESYTQDWRDPNPMYLTDSPFGGPIAPPAYRAGLDGFSLLATKYDTHATIGVKTEHAFFSPVPIGKRLITRGVLADKYIKRGIEYVVVKFTMTDEDGVKIRESTDHIALSVERVIR